MRIAWITAVLCLLWVVRPGDVPFIGDEPMLIENALDANEAGRWATKGLRGTYGVDYGPLPTWAYQIHLLFSHDLVALIVIRSLSFAVTIAVALFALGRTLGLWAGFVPVVLCSPFLWYGARVPWDNTFALPISAVAFAAYAAFLRSGGAARLALTLAAAIALLLVHFMAVAFVAPLVLHLVVLRGREALRLGWTVAAVVLGGVVLAAPYLDHLWRTPITTPRVDVSFADWAFGLGGAHLLGPWGIERIFGPRWTVAGGALVPWLQAASLPILALFVAGLTDAAVRVSVAVRRPTDVLRAEVAGLAVAIVAAQVLLGGLTGKTGHSHYFHATWMAYAFLVWLAVDRLARRSPAAAGTLCILQGTAALATVLFLLVRVACVFPSREHYGATLANQLEVAAEWNRRDPRSEVVVDVVNAKRFPQALRVLRRLTPVPPASERPRERLRLAYRSAHPLDGRIVLVREDQR